MATSMSENIVHASTLDIYRLLPEIVRDIYARLEGTISTMSTLTDQVAAINTADTLEKQDLLNLKTVLDAQNTAYNAQVVALQTQIDGGTKVDLTPLIQDRADAHSALQALIAAATGGKIAVGTPVVPDKTASMTNADGSTTVTTTSVDNNVRVTTTYLDGTTSEVFTYAPESDGSITVATTDAKGVTTTVKTTPNADGSKTVSTTEDNGTVTTATIPAPAVPEAPPVPAPAAVPASVVSNPSAPIVTPGA